MATYRYYNTARDKFRPPSRHYNDLYDRIYEYVLNFESGPKIKYIHKETLAKEFRVKVSEVEYVLHQLNLIGLVSQPVHRAPHDSKREPLGYETGTWHADIYYPKNIEYILKKLNEDNLLFSEKNKYKTIISKNGENIVTAFENVKLSEEEKRDFLQRGLMLEYVCLCLFEEYTKTEWREEAFKKVLTSTEFCYNYLLKGILTSQERKKAFNVILNDSKDRFRGYQEQDDLPFFLSKMICEIELLKNEKEILIHKALREKNGRLALKISELTQKTKVDKYLQDKLDAFTIMYKLEERRI